MWGASLRLARHRQLLRCLVCLPLSHACMLHRHPPARPAAAAAQALEPDYAELAESLAGAGSPVRVAKYQADVDREFAADKFGLQTFPTLVLLPKGSKGGEAGDAEAGGGEGERWGCGGRYYNSWGCLWLIPRQCLMRLPPLLFLTPPLLLPTPPPPTLPARRLHQVPPRTPRRRDAGHVGPHPHRHRVMTHPSIFARSLAGAAGRSLVNLQHCPRRSEHSSLTAPCLPVCLHLCLWGRTLRSRCFRFSSSASATIKKQTYVSMMAHYVV